MHFELHDLKYLSRYTCCNTYSFKNNFISGIGICLQTNLLPQVLKQHFTKNIATANGVTWIGSCIGSFIVIPIIKILSDIYGVSGALLITCGIMLHAIPVAMLLRDPKNKCLTISFSEKQINENDEKHNDDIFIDSNHFAKSGTNYPIIKENTTCLKENNLTSKSCMTKENDLIYAVQNTMNCNDNSMAANHQPMANTSFQSSLNTNKYSDFDLKNEKISGNEPKRIIFRTLSNSQKAKQIYESFKDISNL